MSVASPSIQSPVASIGRERRVAAVSLLTGAAALAVIEGYGAIARAIGVPMSAAAFGARTATHVGAGSLAFGVGLGVFWGTVLAVAFARYARRPVRAFLFVTVPLVALSLSGPLTATQATTASKVTLACAHLLAAVIIIPPVARSLARHHR
jgi:hypothetical protein